MLSLLICLLATTASAQTLQTLCSFSGLNYNNPNGRSPAALALGGDGNFYGTAFFGGSNNASYPYGMGTVFKVTPYGTLTTLVSFQGTNGANPNAALTLGRDGSFYGTTLYGGSPGGGTVFRVSTNGTLTTLANFGGANGVLPSASLTLGLDGCFYGTTRAGGVGDNGTVFKVTTNGNLTSLCSFPGGTNGADTDAALTLGRDGNFYGTTWLGGITNSSYSSGMGTIFRVTTNGTLTTICALTGGTNGARPLGALTLGNDANFYGTTFYDGAGGAGIVFKVTTNGDLTTLCSFPGGTNGANPAAPMTLGSDGDFYGTTAGGGVTNSSYANGMGTVFKVTTNGLLTALFAFNSTNGARPNGLTVGADGDFYGTTAEGGGNSTAGTVFRLLLPPVFTIQPQSQTNGAGATVKFNVAATSLSPLGFQWRKNGTNLVDGGHISGATTNELTITGISDSDAANYSVNASHASSTVTSSNALLTVLDSPFIARQPQSQAVLVGSDVTFNVIVYGTPPHVFQWYFNESPLGSPVAGTNFSAYTLAGVGTNQSGNYTVKVVNGYGSATSSVATLTVVASPPVITTQPESRTNNAGTTAAFSVVASSVSAVDYQWKKNGTNLTNGGNISGAANSTLTVASVSESDAGVYTVGVTNLAGGLVSLNAVLTVITPPSITTQPLGQQALLGSSVSFTIALSGTPPFGYRWRLNGTNILDATNSVYSIPAVGTNHAGNYSVVVTNPAGSVTSSNALLTVIVPPSLALQLWAGYPLLNLSGMLNSNFVVQYNGDVADTNWLELLSVTNLPFSPYQFLDPAGAIEPARFYRAFMR